MQILANALPGLRDLRPPLIAGYLWLLVAWLIVQPNLDKDPAGPLGRTVYELADHVGRPVVAIALSIAAYLLGSASQEVTGTATRLLAARWRVKHHVNPTQAPAWAIDRVQSLHHELRQKAAVSAETARDRATRTWEANARTRGEPMPIPIEDDSDERVASDLREWVAAVTTGVLAEFNRRAQEALRELAQELRMPATMLVGQQQSLFAEVERLRSEAELRLAVSAPLGVALITCASVGGPGWLAALPLVGLLIWQGRERQRDSEKVIADALALGVVKSSALAKLSESLDNQEQSIDRSFAYRYRLPAEPAPVGWVDPTEIGSRWSEYGERVDWAPFTVDEVSRWA
jgi:hypothetical protein